LRLPPAPGGGQLRGRLQEHHACPVQVVGAGGDQLGELLGCNAGIGQRVHNADALNVGVPVAALRRRCEDAEVDQASKLLGGRARAIDQLLTGQLVHDPQ
jgi:hypothetical protein